jgi:hypothetical protein
VFGSCGFLSFSLVFCMFGGRFEITLYIHFIRRWGKSTRHSSAPRKNENEKKGGRSAPFFAVLMPDLWVFGVVGRVHRGCAGALASGFAGATSAM